MALRCEQRAHGGRRYLRKAGGSGSRRRVPRSRGATGGSEQVRRGLAEAGGLRRRFRCQRFNGVYCGGRGAKSEQHGRTPTSAAKRGRLRSRSISKPHAILESSIK